jgi:hypothetical protein
MRDELRRVIFHAFTNVGAFGVFAHRDQVDVLVPRPGVGKTDRRPDVGVQIEAPAQVHVQRREAGADRGGQRALQRDAMPANGIERGLRQQFAGFLQRHQACIDELVIQADLQSIEHMQGCIHDFRADSVAAQHCNGLIHELRHLVKTDAARKAASAQIMPDRTPDRAPAARKCRKRHSTLV